MLLNKLCLKVCLCNYEASILTEIAVLLQYYLLKRIGKLIFTCTHFVCWHIYCLAYFLTTEHE